MSSYDHDNPSLARIYHRISEIQFESGQHLVERMEIGHGERVLDIGCGTGRLAGWIAKRTGPKGEVIGIDPLSARIAIAREQKPNIQFQVGTAEELGAFADESFDAVCLNEVFHWIEDKPKALLELHRVLRPGGRIGVATSPKELQHQESVSSICASVLGRLPYATELQPEAIEVMDRYLTTAELLSLFNFHRFELKELYIKKREMNFKSGEEAVNFAESSSFGNLTRLVPEYLGSSLWTDLEAAFEQRRKDSRIPIYQFFTLLAAEKA